MFVTMPDGLRLCVRPIEPADREELAEAYRNLSPESRRLRFLVPPAELTESMLTYLTHVDGVNHVALVAEAVGEKGSPGVAVARFVRLQEDPDCAEVAVTVADAWQGRGIGTRMLELIIEAAVRRRVRRLRGFVSSDNRILDLARDIGSRVTPESPGVVRVEVELPSRPWVIRRAYLQRLREAHPVG